MNRLVLFLILSLLNPVAQAAQIESFFGAFQVIERSCQESDGWCQMTTQITVMKSPGENDMATILEIGSNNNKIANHLFLKTVEAKNPMGLGIRETFSDSDPLSLSWDSTRFSVNFETGAEELLYNEKFILNIKDGFIELVFTNHYFKQDGTDRVRVYKLIPL